MFGSGCRWPYGVRLKRELRSAAPRTVFPLPWATPMSATSFERAKMNIGRSSTNANISL